MLSTVIIDDEPNNITNLRALLENYCPEVEITGTAKNAEEGIALIKSISPELVFLDIQMPGKSGFDLLQSLPKPNFEIIFVTAYDKYGIQAVKFAALDYLLKPVNIEELKSAVSKAVEKSFLKKKNQQLENLVSLLEQKQNKEEHRLALPTAKETRFVKTGDIVRCESSNNYTIFYFKDGEKLIVSKPIYEYEELLEPYGFQRCHQSHLVNKQFIKSWIKEDGGYLLLDNGHQIPVSRQKKDLIKEWMKTIARS
ncbi:MAG: response regulator transcription factor [Chitinophagaceae bacterium]|nr:response regulator transcription factor [Chitinophagaceae bacterium]